MQSAKKSADVQPNIQEDEAVGEAGSDSDDDVATELLVKVDAVLAAEVHHGRSRAVVSASPEPLQAKQLEVCQSVHRHDRANVCCCSCVCFSSAHMHIVMFTGTWCTDFASRMGPHACSGVKLGHEVV